MGSSDGEGDVHGGLLGIGPPGVAEGEDEDVRGSRGEQGRDGFPELRERHRRQELRRRAPSSYHRQRLAQHLPRHHHHLHPALPARLVHAVCKEGVGFARL